MKHCPLGIKYVQTILQSISRSEVAPLVRVPGIDGTIVGPADLSASLGHLGRPDHPDVLEAIKTIIAAHRGTAVCPGIASNPWDAEKHIEMGYRLVNVGSDLGFMKRAAIEKLGRLKYYITSH